MITKRAARAAEKIRATGLSAEETAAAAPAGGRAGKRSRLGWWAVTVLAVGATGGCGLLHQAAAPAGMEKQISQGERVSAATQAHASPSGTGTSSTGTGARARVPQARPGSGPRLRAYPRRQPPRPRSRAARSPPSATRSWPPVPWLWRRPCPVSTSTPSPTGRCPRGWPSCAGSRRPGGCARS